MTTAAPTVVPGSFLTLHYRLSGPDGADLVNTFNDKPATLSIGSGELSPALEGRLLGLVEGSRTVIELPAGEAFGPHNPEMVQRVALSLMRELGDPDETWRVGLTFATQLTHNASKRAFAIRCRETNHVAHAPGFVRVTQPQARPLAPTTLKWCNAWPSA